MLSGQPFPVVHHPHNNRAFSYVELGFPVFPFVPFASCPITGHH